jgi:hypothetical protein
MINRAKMPRQLRNKGGIMTIGGGGYTGIPMGSRTGFGIISKIKDRVRKLIPNELADVAVKAAPFVAPFFPGYAAVARGLGRFDQRGSISDALKQGIGTYAFGKGVGKLGGASSGDGFFGGQTFTKEGFSEGPVGRLFQGGEKLGDSKTIGDSGTKGFEFLKKGAEKLDNIPIIGELPDIVKQQILVGGVSGAATYIYEKFLAEEPPQEEGETYEQYMVRRRENVGNKMKGYFDNYFKFDKNYSSMSEAEKQAFIDRVNVKDGGRIGYQTGGISSANTLAENIARNRAAQAAFQQSIAPAQERVREQIRKRTPVQKYAMGEDSILGPLSKKAASTIMAGQDRSKAALDVLNQTMAPTTDTGIMTQAPTTDTAQISGAMNSLINVNKQPIQYSNISELTRVMDDVNQRANDTVIRSLAEAQEYVNQTGMPRAITQDDIDTFNFIPPKADTDPMLVGFDYSKEINWSPGQPAPEGYRVVNMMGDEFLERKFPSKEEVARLPMPLMGPGMMPLMGPGMMPPLNAPEDPDAGLSGQEYAEKYGIPYALGGRVGFSEGANIKIKLKQIGYEDTLLDKLSLKQLRDLLDSEKGTFTDQGTYREPAKKGGMPTGIMRSNKAGVMERDYRDKGGFVPVGIKEKADDVPAMLSKNEFVMTADAVRGAGNGSIEKGAQRMYDTMKNLEKRVV